MRGGEVITAALRIVPGFLARSVRTAVLLAAFVLLAPAAFAHPGEEHHYSHGQAHHPAVTAAASHSQSPEAAGPSFASFRPIPATYVERAGNPGEPCDGTPGNHHANHPGCCGASFNACVTACAAGAMAVLPNVLDLASAWIRAAMPATISSPAGRGTRPAERPPRLLA